MTDVAVSLIVSPPPLPEDRFSPMWQPVILYGVFGSNLRYSGPRAAASVKVDLSKPANTALHDMQRSWETFREYADLHRMDPVYGDNPALSWFQYMQKDEVVLAREKELPLTDKNLSVVVVDVPPPGMTHGVRFVVDGKDPLLPLAPNVNADILIGLRKTPGTDDIAWSISGKHDGFPNFTVALGNFVTYSWDVVSSWASPMLMHAPMDVTVDLRAENLTMDFVKQPRR